MKEELDSLGARTLNDVSAAGTIDALERIRVSVLGKKGSLSQVLRGLKDVSPQERPAIGAAANEWKVKIEEAISARQSDLQAAALEKRISQERIDVTLPARLPHQGNLHPITQTTRRILGVFQRLGFDVATGPEAETEYLNFDAINIPKDHPAREMQDTFFLSPGVVLRTHTSPVQIRTMLAEKWPLRVLCPGAVYRCDHDATHSPMFHQVEGLWVDRNVRLSDLKGILEFFAREIFGADAQVRLRPSYFPFVEPGVEVDVRSRLFGPDWLEVLGAGMVHPRLFENVNYPAEEVTGFAFGIGVERIAMLLHGVTDIRNFYNNDVRFLRQF